VGEARRPRGQVTAARGRSSLVRCGCGAGGEDPVPGIADSGTTEDIDLDQEPVVRCVATFRGRVQGVGFRFTTKNIANNYPITGYVSNLPDGSVRLVGEGERECVSVLIQRVLLTMQGNIREHTESWEPASGEFSEFSIRREGR